MFTKLINYFRREKRTPIVEISHQENRYMNRQDLEDLAIPSPMEERVKLNIEIHNKFKLTNDTDELLVNLIKLNDRVDSLSDGNKQYIAYNFRKKSKLIRDAYKNGKFDYLAVRFDMIAEKCSLVREAERQYSRELAFV